MTPFIAGVPLGVGLLTMDLPLWEAWGLWALCCSVLLMLLERNDA